MKVLKFGGSSVGNVESLRNVIEIIKTGSKGKETLFVVVSALGKTTDQLEILAREALDNDEGFSKERFKDLQSVHYSMVESFIPLADRTGIMSFLKQMFDEFEGILKDIGLVRELSDKLLAKIFGYGELLSSAIIQKALESEGVSIVRKDSRELIKTNTNYLCAEVDFEATNLCIKTYLSEVKTDVVILPGFVASTKEESIPTILGRGGSDYTAAIMASGGNASCLEIWTDVDGVYTSDPRIVKDAMPIDKMSYKEAMEMAYFGAKIIYTPTMKPVMEQKVPLYIKNTFNPEVKGTEITDVDSGEHRPITGVTFVEDVSIVNLSGSTLSHFSNFSEKLFRLLDNNNIPVLLFVHSSSTYSISLVIQTKDSQKLKKIIDTHFDLRIEKGKLNPLEIENDLNIVALIGSGMKSRVGTIGKMFGVFEEQNINVRVVAQDAFESNISAVISKSDTKAALIGLHKKFFDK